MIKNKRWGKKIEDKRDWKQYQKELVTRHEIYLDLDFAENWDKELIELNKCKKGAPYKFPTSYIQLQAFWLEKFPSRGVEGISKKLCEANLLPDYNDHSTIMRRVKKLNLKFNIPKGVHLNIGTDGSGFKQDNAGEYFQNTYGKERKKYAKVVITATKEEILAVDVYIEKKGGDNEIKVAIRHIIEIQKNGGIIDKVYDDGAFDVKKYYNFLETNDIESAIRPRSDATTKSKGSLRRKKEVIKFKKLGYKDWAKEKEYGHRWPMTEGHFSAIKVGYGEKTRARKEENVLIELRRKVWIYNEVKKYGKIRCGAMV